MTGAQPLYDKGPVGYPPCTHTAIPLPPPPKTRLSEGAAEGPVDGSYNQLHLAGCGYEKRTAEHCCICIPGHACVERLVDLHAARPTLTAQPVYYHTADAVHLRKELRCFGRPSPPSMEVEGLWPCVHSAAFGTLHDLENNQWAKCQDMLCITDG